MSVREPASFADDLHDLWALWERRAPTGECRLEHCLVLAGGPGQWMPEAVVEELLGVVGEARG